MIPRVIYMHSITSDIEKWRKVALEVINRELQSATYTAGIEL